MPLNIDADHERKFAEIKANKEVEIYARCRRKVTDTYTFEYIIDEYLRLSDENKTLGEQLKKIRDDKTKIDEKLWQSLLTYTPFIPPKEGETIFLKKWQEMIVTIIDLPNVVQKSHMGIILTIKCFLTYYDINKYYYIPIYDNDPLFLSMSYLTGPNIPIENKFQFILGKTYFIKCIKDEIRFALLIPPEYIPIAQEDINEKIRKISNKKLIQRQHRD